VVKISKKRALGKLMKTLFFLESNENLIITDARNAHPRAYPARPRAHGRTPPARVRPRGPPKSTQNLLKWMEIWRYVRVSASACSFDGQRCRQVGAGYAQTTVNTMFFETFHVFGISCFCCFWNRFGSNCYWFRSSLDHILAVRKWMQILIEKPGRR
jgi:hypothetical protein